MPSNIAPQTILFLAANPKDTGRLRLDQELRDIAEGLERAKKRDQFNLEPRLAARSRDIQRAMLDMSPQIIHFSGHGAGEQGLIFEDELGNAKLIDGEALAGLFKLFADRITCVVLKQASTPEGIYGDPLQRHLWNFRATPGIGGCGAAVGSDGWGSAIAVGAGVSVAQYGIGGFARQRCAISQ
jgi:hypothetical protein